MIIKQNFVLYLAFVWPLGGSFTRATLALSMFTVFSLKVGCTWSHLWVAPACLTAAAAHASFVAADAAQGRLAALSPSTYGGSSAALPVELCFCFLGMMYVLVLMVAIARTGERQARRAFHIELAVSATLERWAKRRSWGGQGACIVELLV